MAFFDFFRKLSFFKGRSTEGLNEEDLDFQKWVSAHRDWRRRLTLFIQGASQEALDEHVICHDDRCDLGRWIHSNGKRFYGDQHVFHQLVEDHAAFHVAAGEVVRQYKAQGEKEARRTLNGAFDLYSMHVVSGLEKLEVIVKRQ